MIFFQSSNKRKTKGSCWFKEGFLLTKCLNIFKGTKGLNLLHHRGNQFLESSQKSLCTAKTDSILKMQDWYVYIVCMLITTCLLNVDMMVLCYDICIECRHMIYISIHVFCFVLCFVLLIFSKCSWSISNLVPLLCYISCTQMYKLHSFSFMRSKLFTRKVKNNECNIQFF